MEGFGDGIDASKWRGGLLSSLEEGDSVSLGHVGVLVQDKRRGDVFALGCSQGSFQQVSSSESLAH